MPLHGDLRDVRCPRCGRLFFRASLGAVTVEIYCKGTREVPCERKVVVDLSK